MMEKDAKIYVAGHRGMVGSAIVRALSPVLMRIIRNSFPNSVIISLCSFLAYLYFSTSLHVCQRLQKGKLSIRLTVL